MPAIIAPDPDDDQPQTKERAAILDMLTCTIPELLLNVERAALRGETLPPEWFVRQLSELEAELLAVL